MSTTMSGDERTPLVAPALSATRVTTTVALALAGGALALASVASGRPMGVAALSAARTPIVTPFKMTIATADELASSGTSPIKQARPITTHSAENRALAARIEANLGYKEPLVLPQGNAPMVQYNLHLGCEDDVVKSRSGNFWTSPVVEARLVYHNYQQDDFFSWENGIPMQKVNIYPGDSQTWAVDTNVPDWEYGFALKNAAGQILYEIGDDKMEDMPSSTAPLFQQKECTNMYGMHHNRMAPLDVANSTRAGYVDTTFGSCRNDCVLEGDPWEWSAADKERMTEVMKNNPPKGLGSSFMMYGTTSPGVCTLNLYAQAGCGISTDDIVLHADPRPNQNKMIFDFLTCGHWSGDYSGWRTQAWTSMPEVGPANEQATDTKWKYTYEYTANGLQVEIESSTTAKRNLILAPWLSSNPYDRVRSIAVGWNPAFHAHSTGTCQLAPIFSPRVERQRVPL